MYILPTLDDGSSTDMRGNSTAGMLEAETISSRRYVKSGSSSASYVQLSIPWLRGESKRNTSGKARNSLTMVTIQVIISEQH